MTQWHGPLTRYVELRVAHAPGMPGTFSRHRGLAIPTCDTHVPWRIEGSLTSDFVWSRWLGKRSRHSRRMRNPQFYVSGKRPMETFVASLTICECTLDFPHKGLRNVELCYFLWCYPEAIGQGVEVLVILDVTYEFTPACLSSNFPPDIFWFL